jgi:hypothetical protein
MHFEHFTGLGEVFILAGHDHDLQHLEMADQFTSFVSELSAMYPDDPDFPLFLTTVRLLKTSNPSLLAKYIVENTSEYSEQIMNKNEQFFMEHNFESHGVSIDILSKLKNYIQTMSPPTKEHVWKYCQNIIRLAGAIGQ